MLPSVDLLQATGPAFDARADRVLWGHHTGRPIGGGIVSYAGGGRQSVANVEGIYEGIWQTKPTTGRVEIYRLP
jgi:hypothetical protein